VRYIIRRGVLPYLDRSHKTIALAAQRAYEARRPAPLPQRAPQGLDARGQRLLPNKLVGPQLLEEFLLGYYPIAMHQEVGEHLKHLAPQLDGLPCVMQLMALGV
jgi:hypothetical protein